MDRSDLPQSAVRCIVEKARRSRPSLLLLLLLGLLLAACAAPPGSPRPVTSSPSQEVTTGNATPTAAPRIALDRLAATDLLIQLAYEPTYSRPEALQPFGRVPPFTLFADGSLIYVDEGQPPGTETERAMEAQLSADEAQALVDQILVLGFERLESYTERCRPVEGGFTECAEDASYTILRVRLPSGELREVKIYAEFTDDPEVLAAIREFLRDYHHPEARPYRPERATLFVRPITPVGVTVEPWPHDPTWLAPPGASAGQWARVLEGEALAAFLAAVPRNMGDFYFEHEGQAYNVYLVPWLPGVDYRAATAGFSFPVVSEAESGSPLPTTTPPAPTVTPNAAASPVPSPTPAVCLDPGPVPTVAPRPAPALLVLISEGDLWHLPDPSTPPERLTAFGDVQYAQLSDDARLIAFTRGVDRDRVALWVVNRDGGEPRELVSAAELEALRQDEEALAIHVGFRWVPGTHTLSYNTWPIFDVIGEAPHEDLRLVDAESGAKTLLLPPGEARHFTYTPDGRELIVVTPGGLVLMNADGSNRRVIAPDLSTVTGLLLAPDGRRFGVTTSDGLVLFERDGSNRRDVALPQPQIGLGHYSVGPLLTWQADGEALRGIIPAPETQGFQEAPFTIWDIPTDGSPPQALATFSGVFLSAELSPDLARLAFYRNPHGNYRELYLASADGSHEILYDAGESLEFWGWAPDSAHFVYRFWPAEEARLGRRCGPRVVLTDDPVSLRPEWLDTTHFLFLSGTEEERQLRLGTRGGASATLATLRGAYGAYLYR